MRPLFIDATPIDLRRHNLFLIDRSFRDDFAVRPAHEALPPKFNAISTGGRFVTDAIRHRDVAPVCYGITTLNRLPRGMLRFSKFLFLARIQADCRWIKNNLRAIHGSQPRGFWIPVVPAHSDADLAVRRGSGLETEMTRCVVKIVLKRRM